MKIITICGSLKFKDEIMQISEEVSLQGNCVLSIIYPTNSNPDTYTEEQIALLGRMHQERIKLSDAILVVNIDNYIGNSTKSEIALAESLNKEVIYYRNII